MQVVTLEQSQIISLVHRAQLTELTERDGWGWSEIKSWGGFIRWRVEKGQLLLTRTRIVEGSSERFAFNCGR